MAQQMRQSSLGFWQRVGRFLRGLVRLVLFGLIVAIITAALYYAFPYIYNSNVFPLQNNNQVGLERLQRAQTQLQDDLTDQLTRQRERIAQLEANLTAEREARSEPKLRPQIRPI
jgi:predicted PurR-regulated permease PerM